jgi:putative peptidoglycan lipid II flippase
VKAEPDLGPERTLFTTTLLVGGLVLAGNMLGFVRDVLIAALFGASAKTDAYLAAWTIPETTSAIIMEGALSFVLIPLLADELARAGGVTSLVRRTFGPALLGFGILSLATVAAAPLVIDVLVPGLHNPATAVTCLRLAAGTVFFMGVAGYFTAVLEAHQRFALPALVYLAYNVGIIATVLVFHRRFGVTAAAAGLTVGSACMVIVQLRSFRRHTGGLRLGAIRVASAARGPSLTVVLTVLLPVGLFLTIRQAQVWVERYLASFLSSGAITHLNYASKTVQAPVTFALAVATVSFPTMSKLAATGDLAGMRRTLGHTLETALALVLPASVGLILFAPGIVEGLYERGHFVAADAHATAGIVRVFSIGLLGQATVSIASLPFFAVRTHSWAPVRAAVAGVALGAAVAAALLKPWGAGGVAAGETAGILLMGILLLRSLHRDVVAVDGRRLAAAGARLLGVATSAGAGAYLVAEALPGGANRPAGAFTGLALTGVLYLVGGRVARIRELDPVLDLFRRSVQRLRPV